jgi:hypothetical protein
MPSKMGIIKREGDESCVNINNYSYGDKYIQVFGEGAA